MNKKSFLILFIFCSVALIFMKIYQQNCTVKASYKKQKLEREIELLMVEKNNLNIRLNGLKGPNFVYRKAKDLGLQKISMNKVRFVSEIQMDIPLNEVCNA